MFLKGMRSTGRAITTLDNCLSTQRQGWRDWQAFLIWVLVHVRLMFCRDLQAEIRGFYERVVEPFLSSSPSSAEVNLRGYHLAYSLVTSRAFVVDGYHGLSMVPIADR